MTAVTLVRRGSVALVLLTLLLPGTTAAQTTECSDPYEAASDTVELTPGVAVERGFCVPDRDSGDTDFFHVGVQPGHSYRIELVDRGPGFEAVRFHIEDAYDALGSVHFTSRSPYAFSTRRLSGDGLSFTGQALAGTSGFEPVAGQDLGYSILVSDLGPAPATGVTALEVSPTSVRGGAPVTATIILDGAAPAEGATVTLTSGDRRVQVPPTLSIPAGADRTRATLTTSRTKSSTGVQVTATYGSSSASARLILTR